MSIRSLFSMLPVIFAFMVFLPGCERTGENSGQPVAPRSPLGAVPPSFQRPGNPVRGYDAIINKPYITCGIPYSAYKKTAPSPDKSDLLSGRTGRNAELPYRNTAHTTKEGVELVTGNCLACHASHFNGQLIVGLGNESLDFTENRGDAAESAGAYVIGEAEAAEWRKWADRVHAIAPYTVTDTVGSNPAVNLTWALFAHRDPKTLAWSPKPLIEPPPTRVLPVSVPPWWRMKKKHAMFYDAAGRGDHAQLMILATTLCTDSVEEARAIDAYANDIRAYIAALEPPRWPFALDHALAEHGRQVFESMCAGCHGTYGEHWTYPNLVVGADEVGTDPEYAREGTSGSIDRFLIWLSQSFYGENSQLAPAPGYIAPPLDGIWATAPYLHNGSVPTLEALLNSSRRPKYWIRSFDSKDYNPNTLGWNYTELPYGKQGAKERSERKKIYDTTLPGHSNQGHTFSDPLTDEERRAVLEYLKTL